MDFDVAISSTSNIPEHIHEEFCDELSESGIDIESERRDPEVYAGLEWVLPTAAIVFVSSKYFGAMAEEMGKDHYAVIKSNLKRLFDRLAGPDKEVDLEYGASAPGKVSGDGVPALSVITRLETGRPVKFIVKDLSSEQEVENCLNSMLSKLHEHFGANGTDNLEITASQAAKRSEQEVVFAYRRKEHDWHLVYPNHD